MTDPRKLAEDILAFRDRGNAMALRIWQADDNHEALARALLKALDERDRLAARIPPVHATPRTTWRITAAAGELDGEELNILLTVETTEPEIIDAIEAGARHFGLELEPEPDH